MPLEFFVTHYPDLMEMEAKPKPTYLRQITSHDACITSYI